MKKILVAFLCLFCFGFAAETVEIEGLNAKKEVVKVNVPLSPKRAAVADLAALDTIDALGFGKSVVAVPKEQKIDYLAKYVDDKNVINIGTAKELDMEKLIASEPDVIFIGGRMQERYDELSKIAPVVFLEVDYEKGSFESIKKNIATIAKIYGVDHKADATIKAYEDRLAAIKMKVGGKSAIIGLITSSSLHTLGNNKRCSLITTDAGFDNLAKDVGSTHGNESSFELLVKLNPEFIFILDRDSAIAKPGAKMAQQIMDNELVKKTAAYANGKIFYLTPAPWYLSEGGITATGIMLGDIEKALK